MPGPTIKIPVDTEGLARIGNYKAAAKSARSEVAALEREAKKTAATMGSIPASMQADLESASRRYEEFSKKAKEQTSPAHFAHEIHSFEKLTKARMVKDIVTGQAGLEDVLLLSKSRALRKAAAKVGLGDVAGFLGKIAPAAIVATMGYEIIKHGLEHGKKDMLLERELGAAFGAGHVTRAAFEYEQRRGSSQYEGDPRNWINWWMTSDEEAAEQRKKMEEQSKMLAGDTPSRRQMLITKAFTAIGKEEENRFFNWGGWAARAAGERLQKDAPNIAEVVNKQLSFAVKKEEKRLHRLLTPEEQKEVMNEAMQEYMNDLPPADADKFQKALDKVEKENPLTKPQRKTALEDFAEHQKKKNHDYIQHARDRRFSSAETFGQILWVGE